MSDRLARAVEHRLRTAKHGAELYSDMTVGPETEDTLSWELTARGDVEVWLEVVYPAMARLPGQLLRTITRDQAHAEIVANIRSRNTDGTLLPYFEKRWGVPLLEKQYRIVNVFTVDGDRMSGNPLCVFEDGADLTDVEMQKLARQMNLSETTFVLPPPPTEVQTTRAVRIFTPTFEMPFAGHPTLGTAHVVRSLAGCGDAVKLSMKVGIVDVGARGDTWTLVAAQKPITRPAPSRADLARMLGLEESALVDEPLWVDTGAEQLVIPLRSPHDVARARPDAALLAQHGFSEKRGASMAYVWAPGPQPVHKKQRMVSARFFFLVHGGVVEDPATGSACANLGGWHIATRQPLPVHVEVSQGEHVGRPSRLGLRVDADGTIFVSGEVIELGRGTVSL